MPTWLRRLVRAGVVVVGGLAALELLYIVLINVFLASSTGKALLQAAPDVVALRFGKVRSYIPFRINAEDVYIRVQDPNIQMEVTADTASIDIRLWTLLTSRTFTATRLRADGLEFRMRLRKLAREFPAGAMAKLPPIADLGSPVLDKPKDPPPDDAHYNLISIDLRDIDGSNVREIWVDEYHYQGHMHVSGGFFYKPMRKVRLDEVRVEVTDGTLRFGHEVICDRIAAKILANVPELDTQDFEQKAVGAMDAAVKLDTHVSSASFVNYYLRAVPEVRVSQGAGQIAVVLDIKHGQVMEGSKLSLDTTRLQVEIPEMTASGKGVIRWTARKHDAWLDLKVHDIELRQNSNGKVRLKGPQFSLSAVTTSLDLSKRLNLTLVLDLPEANAADLSFLSDYIPKGAGVSVAGGRGTVRGSLEIDSAKQKARGTIDIDGTDLIVKTRGASMQGRVTVRGKATEIDLRTGAVDFSQSHMALDGVKVDAEGRRFDGFWLKIRAPECKLRASKNLQWLAGLELDFQSLLPIMSVVSASIPLPWVVKAFSDLRDVHIKATLRVHDKDVDVPRISAESGILRVDADLQLREDGATLVPFGAMLVKVGVLPVGVLLEGKKATPVLLDAETWFNRRRIAQEEGANR